MMSRDLVDTARQARTVGQSPYATTSSRMVSKRCGKATSSMTVMVGCRWIARRKQQSDSPRYHYSTSLSVMVA